MDAFFLGVLGRADMFYAVPLIVSASVVFSAFRFEDPRLILRSSWQWAAWIVLFMAALFLVLFLCSIGL